MYYSGDEKKAEAVGFRENFWRPFMINDLG
jgi:hypothetical protein